jgi:hypothetical protein
MFHEIENNGTGNGLAITIENNGTGNGLAITGAARQSWLAVLCCDWISKISG